MRTISGIITLVSFYLRYTYLKDIWFWDGIGLHRNITMNYGKSAFKFPHNGALVVESNIEFLCIFFPQIYAIK